MAIATISDRPRIQQEEGLKAKISSTDQIVDMLDCHEKPFTARVWEGVTDAGVPFTAYIPVVQVHKGADNSQFERELAEHDAPSASTMRAIDMRFIL